MSEVRARDRRVLVIAPEGALTALIRGALEDADFDVEATPELSRLFREAARLERFAGAVVAVSTRDDLRALQALRRADKALPVMCVGDAFLNAECVAAGAKSFITMPVTASEVQFEIARLTGHVIRG